MESLCLRWLDLRMERISKENHINRPTMAPDEMRKMTERGDISESGFVAF
jgi:hypothetical protein